MTIQQAIKSGKPFRRKAWWDSLKVYWLIVRHERFFFSDGSPFGEMRTVNILARDWEIKQ